ncbi:Uu.00g081590.m01.CDS01 [Anthostomella pinea]|uniref:Uu.00g081590.m01.CDS01 n=1 Tax=Anthostomella pinea TaxID=933095 RepID=A0AAI8VLA5_9PEZI|nr:Uu.00g081590.m01.CDS01 [Anthostomella pinea]
MTNEHIHDSTTSNVLAWSSQSAHMQHDTEDEAAAEADEPPENHFRRNAVKKAVDHSESLLTRALHQTEEEVRFHFSASSTRRRSVNSSISLASTADLTSDTGFTSPARTNTPSPPPPVIFLAQLNADLFDAKPKPACISEAKREAMPPSQRSTSMQSDSKPKDAAVEVLAKKRCISFACGPKPEAKKATPQAPAAENKPAVEAKPQRKPCIKFACSAKPTGRDASPRRETPAPTEIQLPMKSKTGSPSTLRKYRSPSVGRGGRSHRSLTPRPSSQTPRGARAAKYLTANPKDLDSEKTHFHEFASDEPRVEDWISENYPATYGRLTINDTLRKENEIRRLAKEAEEEALEEEEDMGELDADIDDEADIQDDVDDDDDEDLEDAADLDDQSVYGSDDDNSDGYNTDNEVGFADSDDEDDGDLELWTPGRGTLLRLTGDTPIRRRPSLAGRRSDSSSSDGSNHANRAARERTRRIKIRPGTPELPDSTDFVCGTLDEDRALEDAYISCIAARRRERLHPIPQDIDPSFPTSEPEDEEEIEPHKHAHDSDGHLWIHGELEDLHHAKDDAERRKKKPGPTSPNRLHSPPPKRHHSPPPKRHHSPPPKRHHSPPPKARGRSPRRLFDRHSPRHFGSPAPGRVVLSPPASLIQDRNGGQHEFKALAFRPGLTHTKSLPRAPALFPQHFKGHRRAGKSANAGAHVRGAIDIVKGLEQKRQRRKEKFKEKYLQKHNNKARKGQVPHRPQPGKGAQRMREIGLLSAGKLGPDQFVLSI